MFGAICVLLAVAHARYFAFLCDDAYITFRYARNLAYGRGLVFNPGEYVEGFTSLFWCLQLALFERLGISSEAVAIPLGFLWTAACVVLLLEFIRQVDASTSRLTVSVVALFVLGINRTWAVWSTSGLETRAFTFFTLAAAYGLLRALQFGEAGGRRAWLALSSISLALATYTRPDALAFFPWVIAFVLWRRWWSSGELIATCGPYVLLVSIEFAWRLHYYGEWLPNTYYAKIGAPWPEMGARYLAAYLIEYGFYLVGPLVLISWRHVRSKAARLIVAVFLAWALTHTAYYCWRVGGDHFEFRIFDFQIPFIAWLIAEGFVAWYQTHPIRASICAAVALLYAVAIPLGDLRATPRNGIDLKEAKFDLTKWYPVTVDQVLFVDLLPGMRWLANAQINLVHELNAHMVATRHGLQKGFWLSQRSSFDLGRDAVPPVLRSALLFSPAPGIMGYDIDVPILDTRGLTDAFVAHFGERPLTPQLIAHDVRAPMDYLERRHANVELRSVTSLPDLTPVHILEPRFGRFPALYSIGVGDGPWFNIVSWDPEWIRSRFRELPGKPGLLHPNPGTN